MKIPSLPKSGKPSRSGASRPGAAADKPSRSPAALSGAAEDDIDAGDDLEFDIAPDPLPPPTPLPRSSAGGGLGEAMRGLFRRTDDPDTAPHYYDLRAEPRDRRGWLMAGAALLLAGGLVSAWMTVRSPDEPRTPGPVNSGASITLPLPTTEGRLGLLTPPGETALTSDRSVQRRPWLSETAPSAMPDADQDPTQDKAAPPPPPTPEPASPAAAAPPPPVATTPAASPTPAPPVAAATPGSTTAAATPGSTTAAAPALAAGAFQRPSGALLPTEVAVALPRSPSLPLEEGFRPGRTPSYNDLPAPGTFPAPSLGDAPSSDLLRSSEHGLLPVIAADGRMPWRTYARPFTGDATRPRVAIIVTGLGMREAATQAAITRLPPDVTLAFDPYAPTLPAWMGKARQSGHETLLELPVEPTRYPSIDPGPLALLSGLSEIENRSRLETVLGRSGGYVGVLATAAGRFTDTPASLRGLLDALKSRGLLYVHRGSPTAVNVNGDAAPPVNIVTAQIDDTPNQRAIDARFEYLGQVARAQGYAIGVIGASPVALYRLNRWLGALEGEGLVLAPASAVMVTGERRATQ
ncbi:divergent polysaccharide deacetylase family protein [Rhodospirillum rubrum]|uniref:divergent polysaccharide deacetylase family protein n=2 Tax=Rhodospirillum rubrum TaxID=1085 RepID=UPI0027DB3A30|nr:divergent polysaccharide deacetylase family protein [Rhodospirillum rubrum]